jgi:hypothetical protein
VQAVLLAEVDSNGAEYQLSKAIEEPLFALVELAADL